MSELKRKEPVKIPLEWGDKTKGKLKADKAYASPGVEVTWEWKTKGRTDPFFILFPDESPFAEMELKSHEGTVTGVVIYDPAGRGAKRFKYIVAAYDLQKGLLDVLDPELIIPRPVGSMGK